MFTLDQILDWTQGELLNAKELENAKVQICIEHFAPLELSKEKGLSFYFNKAFFAQLSQAQSGVLISHSSFIKDIEQEAALLFQKSAIIICRDPYYAMAVLSEKFALYRSESAHIKPIHGKEVHPTAVIHHSVELPHSIQIGPHCVIEKNVHLGDGVVLYPNCYLGSGAKLGKNVVLFPNVVLYEHTQIGDRARVHAGAVIGSDGFGYAPQIENGKVINHKKIYHFGKVVIGNDAEIGANVTIDRGTISDTVIENLVKIDNDVHIGHNAYVAKGAIICGATALAGNASVGEFSYVGGLTGISNHVHVGAGAKVGALTILTKDVPDGGTAVGVPQRDYQNHFKVHAYLNRMALKKNKTGD